MNALADARDEGRGVLRAARYMPQRIREALGEYQKLSRVGKKAYADHWIGVWAREFNEAWPLLYSLLQLVEEEKLYADPRRVGPGAAGTEHGTEASYESFAAYFEDRVGKSFQTWAELENTYQYARQYKPELFDRKYKVARRVIDLEEKLAATGKTINAADGHRPDPSLNIVKTTEDGAAGNRADYLTRRIVRDYPEIAERMKAGEFKSTHAAARAAGITKAALSVRIGDPASVARSLRKHMEPENVTELIRLLLEGE